MKNVYVEGLITGTDFDEFFLLKQAVVRVGSNQKKYIDMILSDRTGDVSAKKWDATEPEITEIESFNENEIVKVRASVGEWQGKKQLKISRFRLARKEDDFDVNEFIKTAPEKGEDMYAEICEIVQSIKDEELKKICIVLMERNKDKLMYYPAASKNHHAEMGGLLYHIKRMLRMGEMACNVYEILRRDWVIAGVIIHDMEKINEILSNEWGISPGYSFEGQLLGHITQGVKMIDRLTAELGVSEEKAVMLEHMILSHHYEPEFGSPKRPMFPEAELLHYLDIFDARIFDMEEALKPTPPGDFSERVRTLENRRLYKSTF
ncbi:MAG: HD domain-containing protein [Firmicutes bacterium]|nr:HD domain-containing protein [Bacillota bacterium]